MPHTNNASVEGLSKFTGKTVKDEDPDNAKVIETPPTDEPSALSSTSPDGQPMEKLGQKLGFDQTGLTTGWLAVAGAALVLDGVTLLMVRRRNTATESIMRAG
ncbi:hypothetical protein [Micrococcoides hystricis]|uniref:LPXTG cell wall anchor domain-containing protein n=1 Tax=Micrococcoides hystricis TaxID=1572761 RepID=A0ABV6P835_9MICC